MSALCQKRTFALQQNPAYSITSSASNWIELGTSRPSALAVCRLMTNSNFVDSKTGRSAGFAPPASPASPSPKIFARVGNPTQGQRVQSAGEEGAIWLELAAIALTMAIGFSVLALDVEL